MLIFCMDCRCFCISLSWYSSEITSQKLFLILLIIFNWNLLIFFWWRNFSPPLIHFPYHDIHFFNLWYFFSLSFTIWMSTLNIFHPQLRMWVGHTQNLLPIQQYFTEKLNFNSEYFLLIEKSPLVEKQGERDDSSTSVRF